MYLTVWVIIDNDKFVVEGLSEHCCRDMQVHTGTVNAKLQIQSFENSRRFIFVIAYT